MFTNFRVEGYPRDYSCVNPKSSRSSPVDPKCRSQQQRSRALMRSLGREGSGVGGSACLWPAADPDPLETLSGETSPAPNAPLAGEVT